MIPWSCIYIDSLYTKIHDGNLFLSLYLDLPFKDKNLSCTGTLSDPDKVYLARTFIITSTSNKYTAGH